MVTRNYQIPDPTLSELGVQQCADLQRHYQGEKMENDYDNVSTRVKELIDRVDLIVTSPLRRTMQTTVLSLGWLIDRGVKVVADARLQETSRNPCDTGSTIDQAMRKEFSSIDFATLDPVFPSKQGLYAHTEEAVTARGIDFLSWAQSRPEKVIAVVSHAGFLRIGLLHQHFMNADYRVCDFSENVGQGEHQLVEWEETRSEVKREYLERITNKALFGPLNGGMKKSFPGFAPTDPSVDFK